MKRFVVLVVSAALVSILFCPMAMAPPSMPSDLQMVQPDPSLPKELSVFFGKWQSIPYPEDFFVIVEKIDEEKASLYVWTIGISGPPSSWGGRECKVIKEGRKYKLWTYGRFGNAEYTLKGEYLNYSGPRSSIKLRRVE